MLRSNGLAVQRVDIVLEDTTEYSFVGTDIRYDKSQVPRGFNTVLQHLRESLP